MTRFIFELVGTLRSEGLTIVLAEQMVQGSLNLVDRAFVIRSDAWPCREPHPPSRQTRAPDAAYLGL
jgi:ABC-type branched-subunit amino acid transport system ATPase component